ncbi:short-chain dehydrogenase/reductase SDR [Cyathus striatus]|nr:short-chain dehydrogenase/reductase SDR [Cyathus striatus]KAF9002189.1 short-chain dehydrogenase/reductase SDR [Cyathus striatus]
MATQSVKNVLVVVGLGNGTGTGGSTARLFAKKGYSVALIARGADYVKNLAEEIIASGGEAAPFPIDAYTHETFSTAWGAIRSRFPKPQYVINAALYNASHGVWKPFLEVKPEDLEASLNVSVVGAFAFSKEVIQEFKGNDIDENGKRGALLFTGATASLRGNVITSAFAAGQFGTRALSQSLAKEFGKQNIHVAYAIIDGAILTDRSKNRGPEWEKNEDVRLNADSIASSYLYLVNQDRSAWTWELDLRPAHEKW